jgi:hypothetical protein
MNLTCSPIHLFIAILQEGQAFLPLDLARGPPNSIYLLGIAPKLSLDFPHLAQELMAQNNRWVFLIQIYNFKKKPPTQ